MNVIRSMWGLFLAVAIGTAACTKTEYLPPEEGEPVPYNDSASVALKGLLENSSVHTLFYQAWQRSHMDSVLAAQVGLQHGYTLLAPTDEAMAAAGWDDAAIAAADPRELDTLLLHHTVVGKLDGPTLAQRADATIAYSLLIEPGVRFNFSNMDFEGSGRALDYHYRHFLHWDGSQTLLINGELAASQTPVPGDEVALWSLSRVLEPSRQTMLEVLEEDGRFSLFLGIRAAEDSIHNTRYEEWRGRPPAGNQVRDGDRDWTFNGLASSPNQANIFGLSTLFAPTDEAFHEAGFPDLDALIAFALRSDDGVFNPNTFQLATDTLLRYHWNWGRGQVAARNWSTAAGEFYTPDLRNEILGDYAVLLPANGRPDPVMMPFDFGTDGEGRVTLRAKESEYPSATVTERNITTWMGPVHVVDRLLVPPGFDLSY